MSQYHVKRKDKELIDRGEIRAILSRGQYAYIALCRHDEPYIVTMNYGYDEKANALYFHCALEGQKLDFIKQNPRVCGTVIEDLGYCHGNCDHSYKSVVFRGKMAVVDEIAEKKHGIDIMIKHLEEQPDQVKTKLLKDDKTYARFHVLRLDIEEITAKQGLKKA